MCIYMYIYIYIHTYTIGIYLGNCNVLCASIVPLAQNLKSELVETYNIPLSSPRHH